MAHSIESTKKLFEKILDDNEIEYEVDDEGQYCFTEGSTDLVCEIYKHPDMDLNLVSFRAILAQDFDMENLTRETALQLLNFSWKVPFGAVTLSTDEEDETGTVWYEFQMLTDMLDEEASPVLFGAMAAIADGIDDDIKSLLDVD